MTAKHSPPPYTVDPTYPVNICDRDGTVIAECGSEADARLLAAAPQLAAELERQCTACNDDAERDATFCSACLIDQLLVDAGVRGGE
jgi:hypothetical protein